MNAIRRPAVPTAAPIDEIVLPPEPPPVVPLDPIRYQRTAEATLRNGLPLPLGAVRVELRGTADPEIDLGVGILDGETSAILGWRDLELPLLGSEVLFEAIPEGEHWLVLARDRRAARFSYVSRSPLVVGPEVGVARLEVAWHHVLIELTWPETPDETPPIVRPVLTRRDDPGWCYRPEPRTSLVYDQSLRVVLLGLGRGEYTLRLEGAEVEPEDRHKLDFALPGTDAFELRLRALTDR